MKQSLTRRTFTAVLPLAAASIAVVSSAEVETAVEKDPRQPLIRAFAADPDYAQGWHDNLAMAAFDEGLEIEAANRAASRFMKSAFDVVTSGPGGGGSLAERNRGDDERSATIYRLRSDTGSESREKLLAEMRLDRLGELGEHSPGG